LRRRLGGRAHLYRLCAAGLGCHHGDVRRQTGGHTGCGSVLAGSLRTRREDDLLSPDSLPGDSSRRPSGEQWQRYDMSKLTNIFSAGERLDDDTYHWLGTVTGKPVVDHWWQTETGWPIVANLRGLEPMPLKAGSPSVPVPGYDVGIVNPLGEPVE